MVLDKLVFKYDVILGKLVNFRFIICKMGKIIIKILIMLIFKKCF